MAVFIVGDLAQEYCRLHRNLKIANDIGFIRSKSPTMPEVRKALDMLGFSSHACKVLIPSKNGTRKSHEIEYVTLAQEVPHNSFYKISRSVYVATPEFNLLIACRHLNFIQSIKICDMACSKFYIENNDIIEQDSDTSSKKIEEFIENCACFKGVKIIRRSLKYIKNNAASPQEIKLGMLLGLPMKYGGYGLSDFEMNPMLKLSGSLRTLYKHNNISPDLFWQDKGLVVEYDSREYHSKQDEAANDELKKVVYEKLGFETITIHTKDLFNERIFHEKAVEIAELIGKRLHYPKPFIENRAELRQELDLPFLPVM